jgi:hypothetical protein
MELWHGSEVVVEHPWINAGNSMTMGAGFIAHHMRKWQWNGHAGPSLMALPIDMSLI